MDLTTKHPSEQALSAWLDGETDLAVGESVGADGVGALEAHLEGCAQCAARLAELRSLGESVSLWAEGCAEPGVDFADAVMARLDEAPASAVPSGATVEPPEPERELPVAPVVPLPRGGRPLLRWSVFALAAAAVVVLGMRRLGPAVDGPQGQREPSVIAQGPGAGPRQDVQEEPNEPGSAVVEVALDAVKEDYKVFEIQGQSRGAVVSVVWIVDRPNDEEGSPTPEENNGQPEAQESRVQ